MRVISGGNVGVGTASPSALLHIRKIDLVDDSRNALLVLDGKFAAGGVNSGDEVGIAFRVENSGGGAQQTTSITSSYQASYNSLNLQPAGGNVGIGTTAPDGVLNVKSSGDGINVLDLVDSSGDALFNVRQSGNNGTMRLYADGGAEKIKLRSSGLSFFTGGSVGIGTTAPVNALHVHGSGDGFGYIRITDGAIGATATDGARIGYNSSALRIQNYENSNISFFTNNTTEALTIKSDGNVGIGDATPDFKLDVAGTGRFAGDNSDTTLTVN